MNNLNLYSETVSGYTAVSYDDNNQLCGITLKDIANHGYSPEPDDRIAAPEINNDAVDNSVSEAAADNEPVSSSSASDSSSNVVSMDFATASSAHNIEPSKVTAPADKLSELNSNDDFSMLLFVIQTYLGKTLSQPETNAIVYFYDTLHFSADLI